MRIKWLKKNWITGQKNWNIVKEKKGGAQCSGERIWMIAIYNTLIKNCYFVISWSKTSLLRHKVLMNACNFFNWFMICSHKQRKWNDVELTRNLIYWETIWLLASCLGIHIFIQMPQCLLLRFQQNWAFIASSTLKTGIENPTFPLQWPLQRRKWNTNAVPQEFGL